jgi:hypothetical protein
MQVPRPKIEKALFVGVWPTDVDVQNPVLEMLKGAY